MSAFDKALTFVFGNEGGKSNDPLDRGGATNMGITQGALNSAYKRGIVKHNDIDKLTRAEAAEIYRVDFWQASRADKMPDPLCVLHFDAAVNHGVGGANALLQKTINNYAAKAKLDISLEVDGAVGVKTLAALNVCVAYRGNIKLICEIYCDKRADYFQAIVKSRPSQSRYLNGWLTRVDRNRALIK